MTMKTTAIKTLLFSTAILGAIGLGSVNTYASEIESVVEPATQEYIAPEVTQPAPAEESVHIIEETQEPVLEPAEPNVEPEVVEPTLNQNVEENQEPEVNPEPEKSIEEEKVIEQPAPTDVKETEQAQPNIEPIIEEENVVQNPEKIISQPKLEASEIGGAGNYQISAKGTGKIIVYVGRKTVEHGGVIGEISGIYSIMVKDGKIDEEDLYLLSLAEDSYLYATGTVTFEILPEPEQEPIVEPTPAPITETEEKEETPAPEVEEPALGQEKETPTVEPKEEENVVQEPAEIKGKYVGQYESEKSVGRTAEVYFDKDTNTLNFKGTGYYFNTNTPAPAPIKIIPGIQKRVLILDTMYQLVWEGNELISIKAENQGYSSQDDEINDQLSKYPVFSGADENDYDAKPLEKYEYLNIDDKNIKEATGFYDAEKLGFYYTDTSFGLDIKKLGLGSSTETALRVKNIKLPAQFLKTKIYQQEVGKLHYVYSFFKGSQRGGYDLVVIYFRLENDGTLTIVRDFHSIMTKGARYADIFAKIELGPINEPVIPEQPTKPETPAPKEEPKEIIEEEKHENLEKGATPANQLNVESKKAPIVKVEKEEAASERIENVKQIVEEENVPVTGNSLVHSKMISVLGIIISGLGTAIFKFKK